MTLPTLIMITGVYDSTVDMDQSRQGPSRTGNTGHYTGPLVQDLVTLATTLWTWTGADRNQVTLVAHARVIYFSFIIT